MLQRLSFVLLSVSVCIPLHAAAQEKPGEDEASKQPSVEAIMAQGQPLTETHDMLVAIHLIEAGKKQVTATMFKMRFENPGHANKDFAGRLRVLPRIPKEALEYAADPQVLYPTPIYAYSIDRDSAKSWKQFEETLLGKKYSKRDVSELGKAVRTLMSHCETSSGIQTRVTVYPAGAPSVLEVAKQVIIGHSRHETSRSRYLVKHGKQQPVKEKPYALQWKKYKDVE